MVLRVREAPEAAETQAAIIDLEGHFYTDPPYIKVLSVRNRREIAFFGAVCRWGRGNTKASPSCELFQDLVEARNSGVEPARSRAWALRAAPLPKKSARADASCWAARCHVHEQYHVVFELS